MFDKGSYRKLRTKGKRGQGPYLEDKIEEGKGKHLRKSSGGFQMVNRKQARQKMRSRFFEGDDDVTGKSFTKKYHKRNLKVSKQRPLRDQESNKIGHYRPYEEPAFPPEVSNHERVFRSRIKSGRISINKGDK